jgi:hypothetical protein
MLPPDSFLRQVPHALEAGPRFILDCAGWSVNSILISFADLEKVAQAIPMNEASPELEHRLFVHCWSIVDQCHALRSLLRRLPSTPHPEIAEFIAKTATYTLIRNSMDHLSENLSNLVNSQQQRAPLFGALVWIKVQPTDFIDGRLTSYIACSVTTGAVLGKPTEWRVNQAPTEPMTAPDSNFQFQVLDYSVDLSGLMTDIEVLLKHFENVVKPRVENNIRGGAQSMDLDPDEVLKLRGSGGLKMAMMIRRQSGE